MKYVFISNNLASNHDKNRIEEFIKNGVESEIYGFTRQADNGKVQKSPLYNPVIVGDIDESYTSRLRAYYKGIKKIINTYKNENVCFYLFGLDIAIVFWILNDKHTYIYEEADLVYTYIKNKYIRKLFKSIDKKIIKLSKKTVLTSEGFLDYHFNNQKPDNIVVIPNKLSSKVLKLKNPDTRSYDKNNFSIGFVGAPRFISIRNFIDVFCRNFPDYTFHIYGGPIPKDFMSLKKYNNCIFHGFFNNPDDLPEIYSNIDILLCSYLVVSDNVRYAEPNKLYEAIFFKKPIIVSKGTFLEKKVEKLGIGFSIDAMNEAEIVNFVQSLNSEILYDKIYNASKINREYCIEDNADLIKGIITPDKNS